MGWVFPLLITLLTACGPRSSLRSSAAPARATGSCTKRKNAARIAIAHGKRHTSPTGLEVSFVDHGYDHFEDGRFDEWVVLLFRRGNAEEKRMASVRELGRIDHVWGGCWSLVEVTPARVVLDLFPPVAGDPDDS